MRSIAALLLCGLAAGCSAHTNALGRSMGNAAMAPFEDFNVKRDNIPLVLTLAMSDPYGTRSLENCESIGWEVSALDRVLGPDMDEPAAPQLGLRARASNVASDAAVDGIADLATDFIPARGLIRRLSGAQRHREQTDRAVQSGRQRRAFLKGMGMQRNCAPPAAPSWYEPRPPQVARGQSVTR